MQLHPDTLCLKLFYIYNKVYILLLRSALSIAAHEAVNTTCCVNELALTGIERVRGARDFYFYHRVSFAFKFYCIISLACRT